jgi:integrase/recombinase XerD
MNLSGFKEFINQFDSEETKRAYERDIKFFFSFCKKSPEKITKIECLNFLSKLKESNFTPKSIQRMISSVRSYFKFLLFMDVVVKNPLEGMKLPRINREIKEDISDNEVRKMFECLNKDKSKNSSRNKLLISLMLYNGLRRSEVCTLKLNDIRKIKDIYILRITGKGNKIREIPLHKKCISYMKDYLESNNMKINTDKYLFPGHSKDSHITSQSIYNIVKHIQKSIKLSKNIHPHMFRAKFASMALESGVPITSVQSDLGHSSIETTAMYDHGKSRFDRSSINRIDINTDINEKELEDEIEKDKKINK